MKLEFTNRAVRDLRDISGYSRRNFGNRVTAALEQRIRTTIANIVHAPESAPRVEQIPSMRVVASYVTHSVSSIGSSVTP